MIENEKILIGKLKEELARFFNEKKSTNPNIVSEPEAYYSFPLDKFFIYRAITKGVPYSIFKTIQELVPFSDTDWAELLEITTKTLFRYKKSEKRFKSIHSEKILEMAEVTILGLEVFEEMDKFKLWLGTPNFALGNYKPFDLLRDSYGKELVVTELYHIEHGIFA
jgi:putative toxin-antitoxin system antitoxin component (TIGR02293 family)